MKRESKTDLARIDAMQDHEIDLSGSPELGDDFFAEAVVWPRRKEQITLRLDPDIIDFFKEKGKGYQTAMNALLRHYVEAHIRQKESGT